MLLGIHWKDPPISEKPILFKSFKPILSMSLIWIANVIWQLVDRFDESVSIYYLQFYVKINVSLVEVFFDKARLYVAGKDKMPRMRAKGIAIYEDASIS